MTHRIEADGRTIRGFQDSTKRLEGTAPTRKPGGYFGIRRRYERGTRYDDVRLEVASVE